MNYHHRCLLSLLILWKIDAAITSHLVEMRVPTHVAEGGEAMLGCHFNMDGAGLYSVKWYKDDREFYRYVPSNKPHVAKFTAKGVHVDLSRSSRDLVTLVNIEQDSAGTYSCEFTGEAPLFATYSDKKYITVYVLPETGPRAIGLHSQYRFGDKVIANCTSSASKPEAELKWLINNRTAPQYYLHGLWKKVGEPPDTIESTLQLKFTVKPIHFKNKVMELKCQATIAPLYHQETSHVIINPDLISGTPAPEPEAVEKGTDSKIIFKFPEFPSVEGFDYPMQGLPEPEEAESKVSDKTSCSSAIKSGIALILLSAFQSILF